eukprot:scaffold4639_cov22-Tisochrysis_lutea.AAC.3
MQQWSQQGLWDYDGSSGGDSDSGGDSGSGGDNVLTGMSSSAVDTSSLTSSESSSRAGSNEGNRATEGGAGPDESSRVADGNSRTNNNSSSSSSSSRKAWGNKSRGLQQSPPMPVLSSPSRLQPEETPSSVPKQHAAQPTPTNVPEYTHVCLEGNRMELIPPPLQTEAKQPQTCHPVPARHSLNPLSYAGQPSSAAPPQEPASVIASVYEQASISPDVYSNSIDKSSSGNSSKGAQNFGEREGSSEAVYTDGKDDRSKQPPVIGAQGHSSTSSSGDGTGIGTRGVGGSMRFEPSRRGEIGSSVGSARAEGSSMRKDSRQSPAADDLLEGHQDFVVSRCANG